MSRELLLKSLGRKQAEVELQGVGDSSDDGDRVLQAELLQLRRERVLLVLQVDARRRWQQLLAAQLHLGPIWRSRRWRVVVKNARRNSDAGSRRRCVRLARFQDVDGFHRDVESQLASRRLDRLDLGRDVERVHFDVGVGLRRRGGAVLVFHFVAARR